MWTPEQVAMWVAQQQSAFAARGGGMAPPGVAGAGTTHGMFGAGFSVGGNMFGGATGGGMHAPPGVNHMYGAGLGYTGMGMGAVPPTAAGGVGVGGVGVGATGGGMPPPHAPTGVPPHFAMPPVMPGMAPPMAGTFPGHSHAGNNVVLPAPSTECGSLGLRCYELGPNDPNSVKEICMEPVDAMIAHSTPGSTFDRAEYLDGVYGASRPVVFLVLVPESTQVLPLYGVRKYYSTGGVHSLSHGKYMGFLGTGNQPPNQALYTLPQSTVDAMGTWESKWVNDEAALDRFYSGDTNPMRLVPPATPNGPNTKEVVYWKIMPCPNALVHLFGDAPHPYVALQRLKYLEAAFPAPDRDCMVLIKYFLMAACHSKPAPGVGSLVSQTFSSAMLLGGVNGDAALNEWALSWHNMLIPPPAPLPIPPPAPAQGLSEAEVKLMILEEAKKMGGGDSTSRGCRQMKDEEYKHILAIGGLPLDTPRENAPPFVAKWEATPHNESAMRRLVAGELEESASQLKLTLTVRFIRPPFAKMAQNLTYSMGYDNSHIRSHLGFSIAAVHYMRCSVEEAAELEHLTELFEQATHITPEQEEKRQGKPGFGPSSVRDLVDTIESYIVFLKAFFGGVSGPHSQAVVMAMRVLKAIYIGEGVPLTQHQLNDIFWTIFLDGRSSFKTVESAQYTSLNGLVNELQNRYVIPRVGTPHHLLSPPQQAVSFKRKLEEVINVRGGDDASSVDESSSPAQKSKKKKAGYGAVDHYHKSIRLKWATIVEKMTGATPRLKDLIARVKTANNHPYSLKTFSKLIGDNACAVGHVTGVCNNPNCGFKHSGKVPDANASEVCKVLDQALAAKPKEEVP